MSQTRRIICICSGNICRSPMAVALLRQKLEDRQIKAVVISAGTLGLQGRKASEYARLAISEVSSEMGEIIEQHRSQGISPPMLQMADRLVVMAPRHERHIQRMVPQVARSIVRLWEYADDRTLSQIPDPVGHDADVFRRCRDLIEGCLDKWLAAWLGPKAVK